MQSRSVRTIAATGKPCLLRAETKRQKLLKGKSIRSLSCRLPLYSSLSLSLSLSLSFFLSIFPERFSDRRSSARFFPLPYRMNNRRDSRESLPRSLSSTCERSAPLRPIVFSLSSLYRRASMGSIPFGGPRFLFHVTILRMFR